MPYYDYECPGCGGFSTLRPMAERNSPLDCPDCQEPAARVLTAPNLNLMAAGRRNAFVRNEKSRHEPGVQTRHTCGSGCGCGSSKSSKPAATRTVDLGKVGRFEATRRKARPWMLGH